jgi:hypothetical protein
LPTEAKFSLLADMNANSSLVYSNYLFVRVFTLLYNVTKIAKFHGLYENLGFYFPRLQIPRRTNSSANVSSLRFQKVAVTKKKCARRARASAFEIQANA